ncbi:MAG: hypothetical protein P1V20_11945 [Verrucomicrobiales bacterium]|nr:hypothetical protein [Verrucomicrobiales bacterium]
MFSFSEALPFFLMNFPVIFGAFKFVGIGFYLSLIILWVLLQGLIFLAERYSDLVSQTEWWRSGIVAATGMLVYFFSWQLPGALGKEGTITASMTSSLICGAFVGWILCGRLYRFELLHRLIVAVGVPVFVYCSIALGKVLEWKWSGH